MSEIFLCDDCFSVLIPIFVVLLAAYTKRVISSLVTGVFIGGILLAKGNIIEGIITATEHIVTSFSSAESIYIVMFLFIFGAFGEVMKLSGGIKGFTHLAEKYVKTERGALGAVWAVTPFTFIDCCFHAIATGTVGKSLTEKVKGNRLRLAHVINVTSCLLIIIIPFGTTYVGYIIGVIASSLNQTNLNLSPYSLYLQSVRFNYYAILMVLFSIAVTVFQFGFKGGNGDGFKTRMDDNAHSDHEAHEQCEFEEKAPPRPLNLIIPLAMLFATTFFFLWYTGKAGGGTFGSAIRNADFEKSILLSAVSTLVLTSIFYLLQKIPLLEIESHFLIGGNEMIPPIMVLILSWGLSSIVLDLGFQDFVAQIVGRNLPSFLIPALLFVIGCATSYFMGSAWGTWALIMPIALSLAVSAGLNIPLVIGAVLAGGSLGDNASPLGETAVLSAAISGISVMDHVKSQLPYCLFAVGFSTFLFILTAVFV